MGRGRKLNENCPSEGQFVQVSNKVCQKVEQGEERTALAKKVLGKFLIKFIRKLPKVLNVLQLLNAKKLMICKILTKFVRKLQMAEIIKKSTSCIAS